MYLRQRHRLPSLKRCSTSSLPAAEHEQGDDGTDNMSYSAASRSYFSFFLFDSLNYASTTRRNARMLASLHSNDIQHSKHISSTDEPSSSDLSSIDRKEVKQITHFGSNVAFTTQYHYTCHELEPYRSLGDGEMDALLEYLSNNEHGGCGAFDDVIGHCAAAFRKIYGRDLHTEESQNNQQIQHNHLQTPHNKQSIPPPVAFYAHYQTPLNWINYAQIQRGIDIFLAFLPAAGCALYYRSLIGGFSIPKIIEVLVATRYLVPASMMDATTSSASSMSEFPKCSNDDRKRTLERLLDTGGFLASCFAPPSISEAPPAASLRPGGEGWTAALRVRVLHAKIRRSLMQISPNNRKNKWNVEKNGVPINQEDMAATLLAFSVNVMLGVEFVAGRPLEEKDQQDYLALWRYLGWLLGVDCRHPEEDGSSNSEECLPPIDPCGARKHLPDEGIQFAAVTDSNILHSYATLESMILHLLHPEEKSRQLVSHLLSFNGRTAIRSEMCRKFLGDPLSDTLNIPQCSSFVIRWMVYSFLLFLRCYTLMAMRFPSVRRVMISWHGVLQRRFLKAWEVSHEKRVGVAMKRDYGLECEKSACPFSMLMAPSLGAIDS